MGLFNSKTTQKTDQKTMPVAPEWASGAIESLVRRAQEQSNVDPYTRVAPLNGLTDLAATNAGALGSGSGAGYEEARQTLRDTLAGGPASYSAESLLTGLDKYRNPYTENVVNTSLAGFDRDANMQKEQLALGLAGRRGGSGADVSTALLGGELGLGRGKLEAGLRSDAEDKAFTFSGQDADRRQSASAGNASLANSFMGQKLGAASALAGMAGAEDANARANAGFQADVGTLLQGHDQEVLDAPWTNLERLAQLQGASGMESLFGEHTTGKSTTSSGGSLLSKIGQGLKVASTAASFFSDERLKRDVARIGTRPDGLGVYVFRYLWSPVLYVGVMAQEVLKVKPQAVVRHPSGFLMVDYARI